MTNLPKEHFPLQDLELERTDLYLNVGDPGKPLMLFGLRGPGGMNCLWPVIEVLLREHYPIDLLIDSAAKRILDSKGSGFKRQPSESPLERIMELKPAVVISEFSADSGTALTLTWSEQTYGVPTVWVEDYPDVLGSYKNLFDSSMRINPNYLCVISEATKDIAIKRRPNMAPNNIIVTGHPDYDKYKDLDKDKLRNDVRSKLGIGNDQFLIVYSGLLPPQTPDVLKHLVNSLNEIESAKELTFVLTRHPRDTFKDEDYDEILQGFKGKVIKRGKLTSDELGFACDLLVAPGPATEALKSAYRRVPSLLVLPDELYGDLKPDHIPITVRFGASTGVFSYLDLKTELGKSINDNKFRQGQIQKMEQNFQADGKAAERVAAVVKRAIQPQS